MKNLQRGFIVPLLIVIAVLVIGGGIYFYSKNKAKDITIDTQNWKIYTNTKYGFSFKYPETWFIRETPDKTNVDFSKSELTANDPQGATKVFAKFYISTPLYSNKEGSAPTYFTAQGYFKSYYPEPDPFSFSPENKIVRGWDNISGIPVFHHWVASDSHFPFDNRYMFFTDNTLYDFVLYAGTSHQPTTYEQSDDALIKEIIGTFSLNDKTKAFVRADQSN